MLGYNVDPAVRAAWLENMFLPPDRLISRIRQGTLHLYEVLIVGMWNGQWRAVEPAVQYFAVLEKDELA
jgi:hypothetical protein